MISLNHGLLICKRILNDMVDMKQCASHFLRFSMCLTLSMFLPEFSQEIEMVVVFTQSTYDCNAGVTLFITPQSRTKTRADYVSVRLGQAGAAKRNKLQVLLM